uniref:K Homology domain-containing protein n=1 Tax=Globisporangium ultimum (strain ATCC 200006 / CBS 805.95 / DAOM BR144) TaxID=431595 RepID=K3WK38_GLOUD
MGMEETVVNVPSSIPLHLVGLKQRSFEKKYGITYQLQKRTGEVVLRGGRNEIKDAEEELLAVFARMHVQSSPAPAQRSTRMVPNKGPLRYYAAKDGASYAWTFVPAHAAFDVDMNMYPYELIQCRRPALPAPGTGRGDFMVNFDDNFIHVMATTIEKLTASNSRAVKVSGNFGKKLFRLNDVQPEREYSWEDLRWKNRFTAVKSSWSNVCDPNAVGLRELIADLRKQEADESVSKEIIKMWIKVGDNKEDDFKVEYVRRNGVWESKGASIAPTPHTAHDIILVDKASLRVWSYPKQVSIGNRWANITDALAIQESEDGDVFKTKAVLDHQEASSIPENVRISYQIVKSERKILFAGLVFALAQANDGSDTMLEVALPKADGKFLTPGDKFRLLLQRVQAVFAEYDAPLKA